jgi:glycerophosphoryl diester phosphodiesterase
VKIVVFGVDSAGAYAAAAALGIDAVMTDSPHAMRIEKKLGDGKYRGLTQS